jgi:hypothetical protein
LATRLLLLLLVQVELSPKQIKEVELVLPEFEAPSVLVSKLSAPLFRKPTNFRLPGGTPAAVQLKGAREFIDIVRALASAHNLADSFKCSW